MNNLPSCKEKKWKTANKLKLSVYIWMQRFVLTLEAMMALEDTKLSKALKNVYVGVQSYIKLCIKQEYLIHDI